jgi:hypothetical protein
VETSLVGSGSTVIAISCIVLCFLGVNVVTVGYFMLRSNAEIGRLLRTVTSLWPVISDITLQFWVTYILFNCHILRICLTYKTGFCIWWSNLLDLYTTCYDNSQITIFDWTLSTSDHTALIHYFSNWTLPHSSRSRIGVTVWVTLRLAVYRQSVRLGNKPVETHDQRFI